VNEKCDAKVEVVVIYEDFGVRITERSSRGALDAVQA